MAFRFIIGAIFQCTQCQKSFEDYRTAQQEANAHAKKTGHVVQGEVTYGVTYKGKNNDQRTTISIGT